MKYYTDNMALMTSTFPPRGCEEITREEFEAALELKESAPAGFGVRRTDGVWESYELPPLPPADENVPDGAALGELLEAIG